MTIGEKIIAEYEDVAELKAQIKELERRNDNQSKTIIAYQKKQKKLLSEILKNLKNNKYFSSDAVYGLILTQEFQSGHENGIIVAMKIVKEFQNSEDW